jgi:DNA sulfur modification protein DndD
LQITKVTLENWGPYLGYHEIDIEVSKESPVVVIWGENGNGKTKFIDALKWVFSGGEFGYIKVGPYISLEAIRNGDIFETRVTVEFEQNGDEFRVTRALMVDPSQLETLDDPALAKRLLTMPDRTKVSLEKVGEMAYTPEQARLVLLRLFPARLVNFYFFDAAELIESFKDLSGVKGSYSSTLDIQNSVETAMGFKGFESLIESLQQLEQELKIKADKEITDRDKLQKLKNEKEKLLTLRGLKTQDRDDSQERLSTKSTRLQGQRQILENMGEYLEQQREREAYETEIGFKKNRILDVRRQIGQVFSSIWAAPMAARMREKNEVIQLEREKFREWESRLNDQRAKVARLEADHADSNCPSCGRELDAEHRARMRDALAVAQKELDELNSSMPKGVSVDQNPGAGEIYALVWSDSQQNMLDSFLNLSAELDSLKVDIADRQQKISVIKTQLGAVDDVNFVAVFEEIQELETETRELEQNIALCNEDIAGYDSKISAIDKQILNLSVASGSQSRERLIKSQRLRGELAFVLQELKTKVRQAIEKESNSILKSLVLPQDRKFEIQISQDYVLTTDKFNPNAGFKQQVILAFLFAIPRVAKAPFPVVIDSPLQHMGSDNRKNFLAWCSDGLSQVVLLPHDAELSVSEVPQVFGSALAKFYELVLDSEAKSSSVKRLA